MIYPPGTKIYAKYVNKRAIRFNIMVAGHEALGKTTFLKLLFQKFKLLEGTQFVFSKKQRHRSKTVEVGEVGHFTLEGHQNIDVYLVDTPGYGDEMNNGNTIAKIQEYLESKHRKWINMDKRTISKAVSNVVC